MNQNESVVKLTGVFIQEPTDGRFTAFMSEVPTAVAQGETREEAEDNLLRVLPMAFEALIESYGEQNYIDGLTGNVEKKSFEFHFHQVA